MSRLNTCRGSADGGSRTQGGARWQNVATCSFCGKRVTVTKTGKLRAHGTRSKVEPQK